MRLYIFTLTTILLFICCNGQQQENSNGTVQKKEKGFTMPSLPDSITQPKERALYLTAHFWDNMNTGDSTLMNDEYTLSNNFLKYIELLNHIPSEQAKEEIRRFVEKTTGNRLYFDTFQQMASFYLYNVSSPLLNEALYAPFAQSALEYGALTDEERTQYSHRLQVAQKNNPGDTASDFCYETHNRKKQSMHSIDAQYTLLFFHDYDCENCKEILQHIASNGTVMSLIQKGILQPLMIYTEGDAALWEENKHNHPQGWLPAFDWKEEIKSRRIYELRAMPSIYLIDKEKKVVLKDAQPERLLLYLSTLQ